MIYVDDIRWVNFLSTGDHGVTMTIDGNLATIITGTNGAGKSTLLDAICYNWFGKAYRKAKLSQLVNTVNKKKLYTETNFRVGSKKIKVIRGMKPTVFEIYIDGDLQDQDGESKDYQAILEGILNINYKAFCQIVILGSANYEPFMDLKLGDRREVIENLLDISVFTQMNKLLKAKVKALEADLTTFSHEAKLIETQHKLKVEFRDEKAKEQQGRKDDLEAEKKKFLNLIQENDVELKKAVDEIENLKFDEVETKYNEVVERLRKLATKIANTETKLESAKDAIATAGVELKKEELKEAPLAEHIQALIDDIAKIEEDPNEIEKEIVKHNKEISSLEHNNKVHQSEIDDETQQIEHFEDLVMCTECGQDIDEEFKKKKLKSLKDSIKERTKIKAENALRIDELNETVLRISEVMNRKNTLSQELREKEIEAKGVKDLLISHQNTITNNTNNITEFEKTLKEQQDTLKVGESARDSMDYDTIKATHTILVNDRTRLTSAKSNLDTNLERVEKELSKLANSIDLDELDQEIAELAKTFDIHNTKVADTKDQLEDYRLVAISLKDDGIKTRIIRHYLPHINETVNEYLDKFDFPVSMIFDENFNEKILSRHRDNFSYSLFSEGEKARINLALMFTWRSVAMMKNRNAMNFIIFDEVFDGSMDGAGGDSFMKIIQDTKKKGSVLVISHDDEIKSAVGFDRVIEAYKIDGFSHHKEY